MLVYSAMAGNSPPPDYDLADRIALTRPAQVKAIGHPLRTTILGLLHERAATVSELAVRGRAPEEHGRPPRQGARRGRARAGREDAAGAGDRRALLRPHGADVLRRGRAERGRRRDASGLQRLRGRRSGVGRGASDDGKLWGFIRHARISEAQASDFWERMAELVAEFDQLPRSGDTMYGFAVGVYPTDQPTLPAAWERVSQIVIKPDGARRARTADLLGAIQALSQLSYSPGRRTV